MIKAILACLTIPLLCVKQASHQQDACLNRLHTMRLRRETNDASSQHCQSNLLTKLRLQQAAERRPINSAQQAKATLVYHNSIENDIGMNRREKVFAGKIYATTNLMH